MSEGFTETQLAQLRHVLDERFLVERHHTNQLIESAKQELKADIKDANVQRREDVDALAERVTVLEEAKA